MDSVDQTEDYTHDISSQRRIKKGQVVFTPSKQTATESACFHVFKKKKRKLKNIVQNFSTNLTRQLSIQRHDL